jgi:hypothetical protein
MHYFGAFERIAKQRGWRLVALTKAGCPPFDVPVYNGKVGGEYEQCEEWRESALERMTRRTSPPSRTDTSAPSSG